MIEKLVTLIAPYCAVAILALLLLDWADLITL